MAGRQVDSSTGPIYSHKRMRNSFTSVDLSTCVNLSTCHLKHGYIYGVCILLRGSGGLDFQAFRCESMPTPLNLTYILRYDCPCFARMRNSFTSVDLSTCRPINLSTCQPVTCNMTIYGVCILLRGGGVWGLSTCRPINRLTCQHFACYFLCTIHFRCVLRSYYSLRLVYNSYTYIYI